MTANNANQQLTAGQIFISTRLSHDPEKHSTVEQDTSQAPYIDQFDDPRDWSLRQKWLVTSVLSATGFNRIMVSTIMAPALTTIANEFGMSNVESVMALSVYLVAAAFGPLVIGPLSEVYGRRPVLHATSVWFLVWNIVCGFANSGGLLIAARLLAGFGASAIYALAGGVLGDVWRPEQRGTSLGLYLLIPLLGAAVGPILGGYIVDNTTWRWMFWSTSIVQAVMVVISIPIFRETYAPVIRRHALQNRAATGFNTSLAALPDQTTVTISSKLSVSLTRPVRLLVFHPIIQIMTVLSALEYGILYILLSNVAEMWMGLYHQSSATSGLHYLSICIGEILGALFGGPLMDYTYRKLRDRARGQASPEFRIPLMLPGALITPLGLLMYGWGAHYRVNWGVVDLGALLAASGMQVGGQASQAYVIDSYPDHASSASGASQLLRGLAAATFPLFAPALYRALGYGWGNTMIAMVYLVTGLVVPVAIWKYGPELRARARSSE